jgi:hypothetical protein
MQSEGNKRPSSFAIPIAMVVLNPMWKFIIAQSQNFLTAVPSLILMPLISF